MSLFDIVLAVALFGVAVYLYFYSERQEKRFERESERDEEPPLQSRYTVPLPDGKLPDDDSVDGILEGDESEVTVENDSGSSQPKNPSRS